MLTGFEALRRTSISLWIDKREMNVTDTVTCRGGNWVAPGGKANNTGKSMAARKYPFDDST